VELTDAQFEQLIGMLAANRVEFRSGIAELKAEARGGLAEIRKGLTLLQSASGVIEEDLTEVQKLLRSQGETIVKQTQAIDGLTQLGKTNFDMNESILKILHGEESSNSHDRAEIQGAESE
jgi:hypothetical protein